MTVSDKHEIAFAFRSTTPIAQCLRLCALRSLSDLTELLVSHNAGASLLTRSTTCPSYQRSEEQ